MQNLKSFQSRPSALIWPGRGRSVEGWNLVDLDASLEHLSVLKESPSVDDLFATHIGGLEKFYPDRKSRLVGVFGESLRDSKILDRISENYGNCGYDIVVLNDSGVVVQHCENSKCKIFLRSADGN